MPGGSVKDDVERGAPPERGQAGPLRLADTLRHEWDILMARGERWALVRAGLTDPDEVHHELEWFRLGNRSVTFHVVERTTTLREQLVDESAVPRT